MYIPTRHLSVRVPWHDSGWNGKVCCSPRDNGSCMFLPRIHESKDPDKEETLAEKWLHELDADQLPPCVGEKVSFMSPHDIYRKTSHPYSKNPANDKFYGHYRETALCYPGYSLSAVPYNWMQKDKENGHSKLASGYQLAYDPLKEPALGFKNSWIQQLDNQRVLLNAFMEPIQPGASLIFIYAKNIPKIEKADRVIIGVGKVTRIGDLTEYNYENSANATFKSTLWERPVYHSIRNDFKDGFLMPYHDLLKLTESDEGIDIDEYIAFAPSFEEFSYGSEWVSNDTAIEALLLLHEKLERLQKLLPGADYSVQLQWIDTELSKIWTLRGPFPGLGPILSGLKLGSGNLIAWELDQLIRDGVTGEIKVSPWPLVERIMTGDASMLSKRLQFTVSDTLKATWENLSKPEKEFIEFLSRMNINNLQVEKVINLKPNQQEAFLENPYTLYENFRRHNINFPVSLIDKAIFTDKKILEKFPLPLSLSLSDPLDQRRIRALSVEILERAAVDGNTLLTDTQLVTKLDEQPVQPLCNPSIKNLIAIESFLEKEIMRSVLDTEAELFYFKLKRYDAIKDKIKKFVQGRIKRPIALKENIDWRTVIDKKFGAIDQFLPEWYKVRDNEARVEKAYAMEVMTLNRFSVLIGPAGTGKTTLIETFCKQPEIASGTILKLAPTGKARVKMGKDAQTLAQFLIRAKRYSPETGLYHMNPTAETVNYRTVIVDEASMLTEDQLAALIDSLAGVERFILIGDFRQLPPIGAGRPFVDIISYLKKEKKGSAELKVLFRQFSSENIPDEEPDRLDVRLSKWFSDDEIKKDEINIFDEIAEKPEKDWGSIRFVEWFNVRQLEKVLIEVVNEEIRPLVAKSLGKLHHNELMDFNASLGARAFYEGNPSWLSFRISSVNEIENWQILSPTKTAGYGTKVVNQEIQKYYRGKTKANAITPPKYNKRKMPRPIGNDSIVYGDKVINTQNTRWNKPWHKMYNPGKVSDDGMLRYMANGEIGLHIGQYGEWNNDWQRPVHVAFSSQPGYAYEFKEGDFQEDGAVQMELAYAVTVHKSQGSGFRVVLFVLPTSCLTLTRELFYTALTRQEDRIVILHQGSFNDFEKFTNGSYSETAKRLTDLFQEPQLKFINKKYYNTDYVQVSAKEEFMISKSEVIIADQLYFHHVPYAYEAAITDEKGITIHPDFTIEDTNTGIIYYWEHLGLLTKDDYRSKWVRKKEWYARNDIIEFNLDPDADKQLILTRDKPDGGIDASEIRTLIEKLFL